MQQVNQKYKKKKKKSWVTGVDLHEIALTDCNRQPIGSLHYLTYITVAGCLLFTRQKSKHN